MHARVGMGKAFGVVVESGTKATREGPRLGHSTCREILCLMRIDAAGRSNNDETSLNEVKKPLSSAVDAIGGHFQSVIQLCAHSR